MSGSVVGYLDWTRKRKEESADFNIFADLKRLLHSYQLADDLMCTLKSLTPQFRKEQKWRSFILCTVVSTQGEILKGKLLDVTKIFNSNICRC